MKLHSRLKSLCGAALLGATAAMSTPAMATNEAMQDLLKALHENGQITKEQYDLISNAARADAEQTEAIKTEAKDAARKAEDKIAELPEINTKGKLEITSSDGDYEFRVGGRLQGDLTHGLGDVTFAGSEGGQTVTEFRRARMYLSGVLAKYWKFKFQYDFAGQSFGAGSSDAPATDGIKDAYLAYTGFKPLTITFGHHKMPLSIEELTSSKYITFIERSQLVNGIVADTGGGRQYGLSAHSYFNDMFTLAGGIYAGSANEDTSDSQAGFTGRLTFSPIHEDTRMVHFGAGYNYAHSNNQTFNIDGEPEIHPGADILETEGGSWEEANTFVAEAAAIYGPFSLQFEYAMSELSEGATTPDVDADAWYIYGSYYLTGESRRYNWKGGSYKQTRVLKPLFKGGLGAWEIALRYTSGDFENTDSAVSSEADILTAGLNWYPNDNVRFSANYVDVLDSSSAADAELAGDLDPGSTADDASYFILRSQWYF